MHHNHVHWQLTRAAGTFGAAAFGENPFERPAEYLRNLKDETLIVCKNVTCWCPKLNQINHDSKRNLVRAVFLVKEQPITGGGVISTEHDQALNDRVRCQDHQGDCENVEIPFHYWHVLVAFLLFLCHGHVDQSGRVS